MDMMSHRKHGNHGKFITLELFSIEDLFYSGRRACKSKFLTLFQQSKTFILCENKEVPWTIFLY